MKPISYRIVHSVFVAEVKQEFAEQAVELAGKFLEWCTSQTDVCLRIQPAITERDGVTYLTFRAGLARNPNQELPGRMRTSNVAYEEIIEIEEAGLNTLESFFEKVMDSAEFKQLMKNLTKTKEEAILELFKKASEKVNSLKEDKQ